MGQKVVDQKQKPNGFEKSEGLKSKPKKPDNDNEDDNDNDIKKKNKKEKPTFDEIQKYIAENPVDFQMKVALLYTMTEGFTKMGNVLKQTVKNVEVSSVDIGDGYYNIVYGDGKTLYAQVEHYLSSIQGQMSYLQAIGTSVFCVGTKQIVFKWGELKEQLSKAFRMMGLGAILFIIGLLISIVFAFYFLDAVMQLGLLGMMMPLMIAGWPFALTKKLATTGLNFLLNTFFVFFFTGFVVSVCVVLIDQSLTYTAQVQSESVEGYRGAVAQETQKGLSGITQALHEQNVEKLADATNIGGTGFMILVFSSLFGFKFMKEVTPMAGKLSQGADIGIAGRVGAAGMSMAKGAVEKVASPITKAMGKKWRNAGGLVGITSGVVGGVANKVSDMTSASGLSRTGKFFAAIGNGAKKVKDYSASIHNRMGK